MKKYGQTQERKHTLQIFRLLFNTVEVSMRRQHHVKIWIIRYINHTLIIEIGHCIGVQICVVQLLLISVQHVYINLTRSVDTSNGARKVDRLHR